jgi:probable H4MPT-linked C1 transfer pathway protein
LELNRAVHAITMTGELVDRYTDRKEGVRTLLRQFARHIASEHVRVYSLREGLCSMATARRMPDKVASANWHATAMSVAGVLPQALLMDIGSTTTDIIPIRGGRVVARALTDAGRLRSDELIYTGVARTPVMAIALRVPFRGVWQNLAAEHFATMADVHQLTGDLRFGQSETADGRGKQPRDCARRLARMLGCDLRNGSMADWRQVAKHLAVVQQDGIRRAMEHVLSAYRLASAHSVVGAGAGRFIVRLLARQLKLAYVDYATLMSAPHVWRDKVNLSAPAVALAWMRQRQC